MITSDDEISFVDMIQSLTIFSLESLIAYQKINSIKIIFFIEFSRILVILAQYSSIAKRKYKQHIMSVDSNLWIGWIDW